MITGDLYFQMPWEAYKRLNTIPAMARKLLQHGGLDNSAPLQARVDWGRWVVDCECKGAEFAFEEGEFMCQSCFNGGHQHKFRRVIFPKERKAIEMLLLQRPEGNRNWSPGESIAKLKAENKMHKAELLEVN